MSRKVMNEIKLTESQFMAQVIHLAKLYGWNYYFTWKSINSPAGFPDLVMVKGKRLIFAELKVLGGQLSAEQYFWLWDLMGTGAEVYLWYPDQWEELQEKVKA
jgi:hypothetical protein